MTDVIDAMVAAGWRYEGKTNGFTKKVAGSTHPMMDHVRETLWVSYEQASACLGAAEEGRDVETKPVSRTVAAILNRVANE